MELGDGSWRSLLSSSKRRFRKSSAVVLWNAALKRRFSGIELVAVCAGEAENARKTVPRAIKRVFWRLLCFYVLGIFVIR